MWNKKVFSIFTFLATTVTKDLSVVMSTVNFGFPQIKATILISRRSPSDCG